MSRARKSVTKRRARGTGSIFYSEARGLWVARRPVGRSAGGYTRYTEVTAQTQGEVIQRLNGIQPPTASTTVAAWGERWLENLTVRPLTRDSYAHSLKARIIPALGHMAVAAVTPHHVELAIREWGRGLRPNTVRQTIAHLRIVFSAAIRAGLVDRNPVSAAKKPRAAKVETIPYPPADLARIIADCQRPPACCVALLAATGIRKGELAALEVADYDAQAGTISITKGHTGRHGTGPPKSPHSTRTIEIPAPAIPAVVAAIGGRKSGRMFQSRGGVNNFGTMKYQWRMCCRRLGLKYQRPHVLRHSVATAMIAAGVGLGDVAAYLGDTVATVVKTYVHSSGESPLKVLNKLFRHR